MAHTLIDHVLATVDFEKYYKAEFPLWTGNHNDNVSCPFSSKHATGEDKRPSFSVNVNGKGGCFCQACGTKVGSIIHFEKLRYGTTKAPINDENAASRIFGKHIRPIMAAPADVVSHLLPWENALRGSPKTLACIKNEVQISENTISRFDLGWDNKLRRVTLPIFDEFAQLLNVRLYRLPSMRQDETFPKILNTDGFGSPAEVFPKSVLSSTCSGKHRPAVVYWMSGERDTLLAWDKGIPSFCYTTGENVCKKEWAKFIDGLHVEIGIVQDNDEPNEKGEKPGEIGAQKRCAMLNAAGVTAFVVPLPEALQGEKVKDFSDFIRLGGKTGDFLKLGRTKKQEGGVLQPMPEEGEGEEEEEEHYPIPRISDPSLNPNAGEFAVAQIGRTPKILNHPITTRAIISGKVDRTYSIPEIIKVGDHTYRIPISREMLQLVRSDDDKIQKIIHHWLNTKTRIKIISHITVTEVEIIPMIQPGVDTPYVNQRCYYFGPSVECNKGYLMNVIPTTDINTQETIGLITHVEPMSNVLDTYNFNDESYKLLNDEFNIADGDPLEALQYLADSVATNHTHIYNRNDLHICALLSWICPLQFQFPCEGLQRGWLNSLILGDTQTGKSQVCQAITKLFQCGVFINAESCSYVGLVGGAVKSSSGMFILRWGKIPLYNRQLVVVEELSGLTTQEISYMSEIRSAGVARYDKAGLTGETSAKTRLICLSNVRGEGKSLGDYGTGVQAAQALVGQHEDLARFDLIMTATDDEVKAEIINQDRSGEVEKVFSPREYKAFHELVMFAWSLKPEQIDFTIKAYQECLTQTLKMSNEYHASLPVFKAGSGRLKLARIAVSIACLQFSWDNDKKKLIVTAKHVQAAAEVLNLLFRKPSFGYARYSKTQFNLQKVLHEEEVLKKVRETFSGREFDFYSYVSHSLAFTKFELSEALGAHHMYIERVISQMFLSNLLKKGNQRSEWTLSRAGRKWVDKKLNGV